MHKKSAETFGWSQQNTIGSTPQINMQSDKWIEFWREQRLGYQLNLAKQNGANVSLIVKGETLIKELDSFFVDYKPKASLLHGDLWSGNYGFVEAGEPVIFDPAIYYGDREADIAMTELFGVKSSANRPLSKAKSVPSICNFVFIRSYAGLRK